MAEKLDENAERAQFEQDVLKAAQDAMNLEANASKDESVANEDAADKAADAEGASENQTEEKAAEQQAEPSAAPDPTEILKQQLADANDLPPPKRQGTARTHRNRERQTPRKALRSPGQF